MYKSSKLQEIEYYLFNR